MPIHAPLKISIKWTTIIDLALIVLLVAAVYFPTVTHRFGHTDDFRLFFSGDDLREGYMSAGRPLLALGWWAVHDSIRCLDDLATLRLLAILGICAVACQMYVILRRMTESRVVRVALSVGIATLPSITEMVAWATCCLYPISALLALWAASLTMAAVRLWKRNWRKSCLLGMASFCLVLLSAGIYQPTVSWFWLVPLVAVLDGRFMSNARYRARLHISLAAGMMQFAGCFVALKLFFLVCGVPPQARTALLGDPLVKLNAFIRVQMPLALNQWQVIDVNRKPLIAVITIVGAAIILVGFLAFIHRLGHHASTSRQTSLRGRLLIWFGTVTATTLLAHAHWWVLSQTPKDYRTSTTLSICVTLLLGWAVLQLINLQQVRVWRTALTYVVFLAVGVLAVAKGRYNVDHYWVYPHSTAYSFLVEELSEKIKSDTKYLHLIRQKSDEGIVDERNIHAYGRPFTDVEWDWAPPAIVKAALIDSAILNPDINPNKKLVVVQELSEVDTTFDAGVNSESELLFSSGTGDQPVHLDAIATQRVVIDMRILMKFRR